MTWFTPGEVPPADEMTGEWWDATREHRLTVQTCGCGHRQHPPRAVCTGCGRTDALTLVEASGAATVDTYTVVHRAPRPDVATPYVVARVRLAEGPVLLTRLMAEPAIGDAVTVGWVDLPDGRALPVFTPARPDEETP
ncbi:hypothetical protein GON03_04570 [Nocardioides sp. MAH-18]|uniref:DNA-binding protein n=1 Tax=Nocardioides agri TaxID=2682843 RepID=A0A6L6XNQ0_9ACTN|nr:MULTISPECIES: OB-fold domain-containing protein [unclassified Nocardioides]MBA2953575.1 OB-fold domain-containing protein [Nocardioides sp. CGMCC 1.13656]MVQ48442.1 hypothetical protein [Nocardioides sp. MAH-18]